MNVLELYRLTEWFEIEVVEKNIFRLYQQLAEKLTQNAQNNSAQLPFEDDKNSLVNALSDMKIERLTYEQREYLEKLGIEYFLGEGGKKFLHDTFYLSGLDIATVASKISDATAKISVATDRIHQIRSSLSSFVTEYEDLDKSYALMRVKFTHQAAIDNVVDFKNWAASWFDISRGIAMAQGHSPESIKIVGASTGSVVIDFSVLLDIAQVFGDIILAGLIVADKILDIKIKSNELKDMGLPNPELAQLVMDQADEEKEKQVINITNHITTNLGLNQRGDGDKIIALTTSIDKLVSFFEKGGVVDLIQPDMEIESTEDAGGVITEQKEKKLHLKETFEKIRTLEEKHRRLTE